MLHDNVLRFKITEHNIRFLGASTTPSKVDKECTAACESIPHLDKIQPSQHCAPLKSHN